ncbi:MAG: InlB B-repeat-containing protein [Spirochaetales bacterium]
MIYRLVGALGVLLLLAGCSSAFGALDSPYDPATPSRPVVTVVFDPNGALAGTVPVDAAKYGPGDEITLPGNTGNLVKPGYQFDGWRAKADGSGDLLVPAAKVALPATSWTLYADWVADSAWVPTSVSGAITGPSAPVDNTITVAGPTTASFGSASTFTATAPGTPTGYQWYVSGTAASGATFATFAWTPVQGTDLVGNNLVSVAVLYGKASYSASTKVNLLPPSEAWARTVVSGASTSYFYGVATDSAGAVITVGYQGTAGAFLYSPAIPSPLLLGRDQGSSTSFNSSIVKYDKYGTVAWVRTTAGTPGSDTSNSQFSSVDVDSTGNLFAVGYQGPTQSYKDTAAGSSPLTVTGAGSTNTASQGNPAIVSFSPSGAPLRGGSPTSTVATALAGGWFKGVKVHGPYAYAVGYQKNIGSYTYGGTTTKTITGASSSSNAMIVAYDTGSLNAAAAAAVQGPSTGISQFNGVTTNTAGDVYACGTQNDTASYSYSSSGGPASVAGFAQGTSATNAVLVKYDSSLNAQWAKSVLQLSSSAPATAFTAVATDSAGNVYACGYVTGTTAVGFGSSPPDFTSSVQVTGTSTANNALLVKYDSLGNPLWAKTVLVGPSESRFDSVAVDSQGNVFVGGRQFAGDFDYGSGIVAGPSGVNGSSVVVKYSPSGAVLGVKVATAAAGFNRYFAVAVDASDKLVAAGVANGIGTFTFGTGLTTSPTSDFSSAMVVKYGY